MRSWMIAAALMGVAILAGVLAQSGVAPAAEPSASPTATLPASTAPTTTTTPITTTSTAPAGFVVAPGVVRAGKELPWSATQPTQVVPRGLGVNIHFHDPRPGELEMMAAAGVSIVRMDVMWRWTEKVKGQYDFSAHERFLAALEKHNIRWLAILCYGNPFYDDGQSPHSEEGRAAFVAWAKAFVTHFKGRGVLWEMWNEPNIAEFWKPTPNADHYIQLALAVGKMMREVAPDEAYIGPATSRIDLDFLESCFKAGLLEYWDAVTVHPYRQTAPETTVEEYVKLGALIARYKPEGKYVPILSGEWGYSDVWEGISREQQAKYLARQWLMNLACDVPVSIWYDWHDDGTDPKDPEHHFGTVAYKHRPDKTPLYEPKPAYIAMKTLSDQLSGYTFDKRLWRSGGFHDNWFLVFRGGEKGEKVKIVTWTTAEGATFGWNVSDVRTHLGEAVTPSGELKLTDAPLYIVPKKNADNAVFFADWPRLPWVVYTKGSGSYELSAFNRPQADEGGQVAAEYVIHSDALDYPLFDPPPRQTALAFTRGQTAAVVWLNSKPRRLVQLARMVPLDPIDVKILPPVGREYKVLVLNPSGEPFAGVLSFCRGKYVMQVELAAGQTQTIVTFPSDEDIPQKSRLNFKLVTTDGNVALCAWADGGLFARISVDAQDAAALAKEWTTHTEGDKSVERKFSIASADAPEGLGEGVRAIKISYDYAAGWTFGKVMPRTDDLKKLPAHAERLEMWVHGDGSGNRVRVRVRDSEGQTFQSELGVLDFTGWRFLSARLDKPDCGHWGGAADGVIRGPLELDTLILICKPDNAKPSKGEIHIALPQVVSR